MTNELAHLIVKRKQIIRKFTWAKENRLHGGVFRSIGHQLAEVNKQIRDLTPDN